MPPKKGIGLKTKASDVKKRTVKKRTRRIKRRETFNIYIYKVFKSVYPELGLTKKAISVVNNFVEDIFERIAGEASTLLKKNGRKTLSARDIESAVLLVLPGELAKYAVVEGKQALHKYNSKS